eukprot:7389399-Prymnesium_polylepis.3
MPNEKLRCSRDRLGGIGGGDAATTGAGGGDGDRSAQQTGHCARIADRPAHDAQVLKVFKSIIPLSADSCSHDSGAAGGTGACGGHGGVIGGRSTGGRAGGFKGTERVGSWPI